jgi:hypothetical protein
MCIVNTLLPPQCSISFIIMQARYRKQALKHVHIPVMLSKAHSRTGNMGRRTRDTVVVGAVLQIIASKVDKVLHQLIALEVCVPSVAS